MGQSATHKELRQFGLLVGGIVTIIGLWPRIFHGEPLQWWVIASGGLLGLVGAMRPQTLGPLHVGWRWGGHGLGWINTRILLGLIFYGLVTPLGILFRFLGKDTIRQSFDKSKTTYRVPRSPRLHSHMKRQF